MFDFGFIEFIVIATVAVLAVGPKELPAVMQALGRLVRRFQYIRYAVSQQFEDFMEQSDLKDIQSQVNFEAKDFNEEEADEDYFDDAMTQESSRRKPGSGSLREPNSGFRRRDTGGEEKE